MVDQRRTRNIDEAAKKFAEALAESYKTVYQHAEETQERQAGLTREFFERVTDNLREQTESGRATSERLTEQARTQQKASQALAQESVAAYMGFLDSLFTRYESGAEMATRRTQEAIGVTTRSAADATVRGTEVTARSVDATVESAREINETATFPIAGYDEKSVEEVIERLDALSDEQIRQLRDYERNNKDRKSLIDRFDSKLRAS